MLATLYTRIAYLGLNQDCSHRRLDSSGALSHSVQRRKNGCNLYAVIESWRCVSQQVLSKDGELRWHGYGFHKTRFANCVHVDATFKLPPTESRPSAEMGWPPDMRTFKRHQCWSYLQPRSKPTEPTTGET
jgi:hypothetical protein